ncbi:ABC transporter ATP-binding protein [Sphingomonas jeddahensis]|uniref:Hemin import ATP-binding protein HmuV n=1 Tax=Sphingomonas jeddahensis TaxID=1915074 RepID=A0A1V2ESQ0_9SPHN|nr:ABC transporter ATP-binding protein [Sphingomonas jeddahensis]ONF95527.1 Hemin import ATP-binding protein HmuV [Sphingomonas jeddahensis]
MGLSAEGLTVALGSRTVLRDVSADFATGRVTVVLGANGAGKSTLLRAVAALVRVADGRVALDGSDVAAMPARARAQAIGYLPQDSAVHWNMGVRDVVALGRLPHGDDASGAIAAALAATRTQELADRSVRDLSGGERARVLLARVLAGEPRWLLADEPLASLDLLHQLETLALLRGAAAGRMGVVVVLHDLTHAAAIADEVLLLKDGQVLAHGPAETVMTPAYLASAYGVRVEMLVRSDGRRVIVPSGLA